MNKKRHLLPVIMVGATALGGCDDAKKDATKEVAKADEAKAKEKPKADSTKTETKDGADKPPENPPKDPPKDETKDPPKDGTDKPPTTIIHEDEPIPVRLGGAAMPVKPPSPPPKPEGTAPAKGAAAPAEHAAAPAPAAAAPAPAAAAPAPADGDDRVAVAIVHNHAPGEPCSPLTQDEVSKALDDLKSAK